jgi:UDP-N-acetylglucosamine 4,6-dehydratase
MVDAKLLHLNPGNRLEGHVLITGGTGSLGQAIVRRARREDWPCKITVFSRDEVKQGQMKARHPKCRYVLGDVRDLDALLLACQGQDIVIHAGALKVVPSAEANAHETVKTNVCGSCNVAMAAVRCGVKQVVGISTDKAAKPINCYGKSKAIMESVFVQANTWGQTKFHLTRYGNVIGSRGSIIPLFQRQAAAGGPLTVTDRRMNRFWLTLMDAVDLILCALATLAGVIVVPKCPTMKVDVLAEAVWEMHVPGNAFDMIPCGVNDRGVNSFKQPDMRPPIEDIGIRPGEKLEEHLLHSGEALHAEALPDDSGFWIFPPDAGSGHLPDGFEYRTDTARVQLSIPAMQAAIRESEEEERE